MSTAKNAETQNTKSQAGSTRCASVDPCSGSQTKSSITSRRPVLGAAPRLVAPERQEQPPQQEDGEARAEAHQTHRRESVSSAGTVPIVASEEHPIHGGPDVSAARVHERETEVAGGVPHAVE